MKKAKIKHLGEVVDCYIEEEYNDGTVRVAIPCYDWRGFHNGEWCKTVHKSELINNENGGAAHENISKYLL